MVLATLYYFHDPMCSWCWGYRPVADQLFANLPAAVVRSNILGGLAPDSSEPMPMWQRAAISGHWKRIEEMLGTTFNYDFWTHCQPRRSTYPACRAVIAASKQGHEDEMVLAIQKAYYLEAQNPSDLDTLQQLAAGLGLNSESFRADMASVETETELQRQIQFSRASISSGFPSLQLKIGGVVHNISVDYKNADTSLAEISVHLSSLVD